MMTPERTDSTATVELPTHVVDRIEARLPVTKYETVDEYVAVVLDGLLRELADAGTELEASESSDVDDELESEAVAERLSSLGYL